MRQKAAVAGQTQTSLLEQVTSETLLAEAGLVTQHNYLATITEIDAQNNLWLKLPSLGQSYQRVCAHTCVPVCSGDIGRSCLVSFIEGTPNRPVVMGLMHTPNEVPEEVAIQASEKVSLECGGGRVELFENGHINIQGRSINSQAQATHRIKGGSVKLN
jgi:hypothetical protein